MVSSDLGRHEPLSGSRIEPGAVTDAALCRYMPLLAEQEL
jgi:hypothetical protein